MTQEVINKVDQIQHAVKEMREANDANLKKYDGLLAEKTDKINNDITTLMDGLDKLQKRANRVPLAKDHHGREIELSDEEVAHNKGFNAWLRKGDDEHKLTALEAK